MVEVTRVADEMTTTGIAKEIGALKSEVTKLLTDLSEKLEDATARYQKIKISIELKEKELDEVYGIDKSAHSLAALIEANRQKKEEFERDMSERRMQLDEEINAVREAWDREKKEHEEAQKELKTREAKERQREAEEYKYLTERDKMLIKNQFGDEKAKLEKDIAIKRESVEKEIAELKEEIVRREKDLSEREKFMDELQAKVNAFPKEMERALDKTTKELTEKLTAEAAAKEALQQKESEGERNVLKSKIEALEKMTKEQNLQIDKLSKQLEASYQKVQDIAVKAIEGNRESSVLSHLGQMIKESGKKQASE
jgi:uncharacterized coiled-coil protein SlyX